MDVILFYFRFRKKSKMTAVMSQLQIDESFDSAQSFAQIVPRLCCFTLIEIQCGSYFDFIRKIVHDYSSLCDQEW